jgi:REP element-mobilizing transposase RayT
MVRSGVGQVTARGTSRRNDAARPTGKRAGTPKRKRKTQGELFDPRGRAQVRNGRRVPGRRRKKPGRKPKGLRAGSPHKTRPELKGRYPVHVVLRVVDEMGSLRKRHMYKALREASISVAKRELNYLRDGAFRIVHVSVQRNHIHLLVEADHKTALSRGMQSFQISAAKHLNRAVSVKSRALTVAERRSLATRRAMAKRRRGTVFPDRFHQVIITTPRQARNTLAYVLNNWRKHREHREEFAKSWAVDPYSTAYLFDGWKGREEAVFLWEKPETYDPLIVYLPKTWLLREGWRMYGLIDFTEVPSARKLGGEVAAEA